MISVIVVVVLFALYCVLQGKADAKLEKAEGINLKETQKVNIPWKGIGLGLGAILGGIFYLIVCAAVLYALFCFGGWLISTFGVVVGLIIFFMIF